MNFVEIGCGDKVLIKIKFLTSAVILGSWLQFQINHNFKRFANNGFSVIFSLMAGQSKSKHIHYEVDTLENRTQFLIQSQRPLLMNANTAKQTSLQTLGQH